MLSLSWESRLTTLSPRLLVYPHFTHAMNTFFSSLEGRRVVPHFGQNCKNLSAHSGGCLANLFFIPRSLRNLGQPVGGQPSGVLEICPSTKKLQESCSKPSIQAAS